MVDDDPRKYPAGLLFEWQREHETRITKMIGKPGADSQQRYERRHLEELGRLSYLAERIVLEKGELWEYRLTGEVLRSEMSPTLRRWDALKRGLYMKPSHRLGDAEFFTWLNMKMTEAQQIVQALSELTNVEFARSWGPPGVSGNDIEIVSTCRLCAEMCVSALAWEESVRFVTFNDAFSPIRALLVGIIGQVIDEMAKVPAFISKIVADDPASGNYELKLVLRLPDGWQEAVQNAMQGSLRMISPIGGANAR